MLIKRAFLLLAILFAATAQGAIAAPSLVPLDVFSAETAMGPPRISPDGRHLAVATRNGKTRTLVVQDLEAAPGSPLFGIDIPDNLEVDWVDWANDDRILLGLSKPSTERWQGRSYDTSLSRVIAVDRDGKNLTTLFAKAKKFRDNNDLTGIVHQLPAEPKFVLMATNDNDSRYNIYRVNVDDGKAEVVQRGTVHTVRWMADLDGVPRVRWDYRPRRDRVEIYVRKGDSDDWDMVAQYGQRDLPEFDLVGFTGDKNVAIAVSRRSTDRFGLYEYNLSTRAVGKAIYQHPTVDVGDPVGGPVYDPQTAKLVGVFYVEDIFQIKYTDPDLARLQAKFDAMFPDAAVIRAGSWSQDRARFVVTTIGPKDPGSYYFYDAKKDHAKLIGRRRPNISSSDLGEMLIIKYNSRDGTKLPGYLTLPPGKSGKNLPLIVMPHGGPEVRDYVTYDNWAQFLANRGYAVFQPNFRGSGGYGKAFAEAGHRQWGRRMQDDVSDGVKALIADGTADAGRVCIVGGSYGGYAALAGGAYTPDLYKCVVAIAGVSDIPAMLQEEETRFGDESAIYEFWKKRLGDPKVDLAQMQSVSPALQPQNFKVPVLLIHGDDDDIVPIDQSKRMEKALRAAGKNVQFVTIEDEGHHFSKPASELKLLKELEKFLTANIGN
ncbi:MAG: alpha/beta fold hydrolase [Alphaproteobacteria bacterium]|nr:alpha/beta fold hydrolase [Alphaproteobacteria bacterium]